jgi:hypothetical protein
MFGTGHPQLVKNFLSLLENIPPGVTVQVDSNLTRGLLLSLAALFHDLFLLVFRKKFFRMSFE